MLIGKYQFVFWSGPWHFGWHEMPLAFRSIYAAWVFWIGPLEIRKFIR